MSTPSSTSANIPNSFTSTTFASTIFPGLYFSSAFSHGSFLSCFTPILIFFSSVFTDNITAVIVQYGKRKESKYRKVHVIPPEFNKNNDWNSITEENSKEPECRHSRITEDRKNNSILHFLERLFL